MYACKQKCSLFKCLYMHICMKMEHQKTDKSKVSPFVMQSEQSKQGNIYIYIYIIYNYIYIYILYIITYIYILHITYIYI